MSVVSSNRPPSAGFDLWFAFRESANDPWGPQVRLYNFWGDGDDLEPVLSSDGLELLFVSDRAGSNGMAVWSSEKDWRGAWSFPARLAGVDTAMNERSPVLSGDDRTLMVARPQLLGQDLDWVMYRRGGRGHPFTLFRWVSEINSTQSPDFGGQRPGDGFSMFFTRSSLIGITSILRADRIQPVVDGPRVGPWPKPVTVSFTLRRDPGDFGFLAIGLAWTMPTPVPPVVGDLLIAPLAIVASGPLDANGLLTWSVLPPTGIGGLPVYFQGLAQDGEGRLYLSNRHTFVSP
jgi:hypothetical protein